MHSASSSDNQFVEETGIATECKIKKKHKQVIMRLGTLFWNKMDNFLCWFIIEFKTLWVFCKKKKKKWILL
jgi:hypothetical protein